MFSGHILSYHCSICEKHLNGKFSLCSKLQRTCRGLKLVAVFDALSWNQEIHQQRKSLSNNISTPILYCISSHLNLYWTLSCNIVKTNQFWIVQGLVGKMPRGACLSCHHSYLRRARCVFVLLPLEGGAFWRHCQLSCPSWPGKV